MELEWRWSLKKIREINDRQFEKISRENKIRIANRKAFMDILVFISEKARTITSYKTFLPC